MHPTILQKLYHGGTNEMAPQAVHDPAATVTVGDQTFAAPQDDESPTVRREKFRLIFQAKKKAAIEAAKKKPRTERG